MTAQYLGVVASGVYGSGTKVDTRTVAVSRAVPSGHTLVVNVVNEASTAAANITDCFDAQGNDGVPFGTSASGTTRSCTGAILDIDTALNNGDLVSVVLDETRGRWVIIVEEWAGLQKTPADKFAANNDSVVAMTGGATAVTSQADEVVIGCFAVASGKTVTATGGSGYTLGGSGVTAFGSGDHKAQTVYKIVSATGAQNAAATEDSSGAWAGYTITLKSAVTAILRPVSDGTSTTTGDVKQPSGAASYAACVNDQDNATYVRSISNPDGTLYREFNVATPGAVPTAGSAAQLSFIARANSASAATGVMKLYAGTGPTLIKTFTQSGLSSTFTQYDLTLTSSEVAAITGASPTWNNLKLRWFPQAS